MKSWQPPCWFCWLVYMQVLYCCKRAKMRREENPAFQLATPFRAKAPKSLGLFLDWRNSESAQWRFSSWNKALQICWTEFLVAAIQCRFATQWQFSSWNKASQICWTEFWKAAVQCHFTLVLVSHSNGLLLKLSTECIFWSPIIDGNVSLDRFIQSVLQQKPLHCTCHPHVALRMSMLHSWLPCCTNDIHVSPMTPVWCCINDIHIALMTCMFHQWPPQCTDDIHVAFMTPMLHQQYPCFTNDPRVMLHHTASMTPMLHQWPPCRTHDMHVSPMTPMMHQWHSCCTHGIHVAPMTPMLHPCYTVNSISRLKGTMAMKVGNIHISKCQKAAIFDPMTLRKTDPPLKTSSKLTKV